MPEVYLIEQQPLEQVLVVELQEHQVYQLQHQVEETLLEEPRLGEAWGVVEQAVIKKVKKVLGYFYKFIYINLPELG